jgi:HNH endonuclease
MTPQRFRALRRPSQLPASSRSLLRRSGSSSQAPHVRFRGGAWGGCGPHGSNAYAVFPANGSMVTTPPMETPSSHPAFFRKIDRSAGALECWPWTKQLSDRGYGKTRVRGFQTRLAHRIAWSLMMGPIPLGLCVLHRCDNRRCCNPAHLFLGTVADNNADMWRKGRGRAGRGLGGGIVDPLKRRRKLTVDQVLEMRRLNREEGYGIERIAKRFDVTRGTAGDILRGRTWSPETISALQDAQRDGAP